MTGKDLICLKKIYSLLWVNMICVCITNVNSLTNTSILPECWPLFVYSYNSFII